MPLTPLFSLNPRNQTVEKLKPGTTGENWNDWLYKGDLGASGVHFSRVSKRSLTDQYNENKFHLQCSPICDFGESAPSIMPQPYYKYSCVNLSFRTSATTDNQYLLIFQFVGGGQTAIYLNGNLVKEEPISFSPEVQTIAFIVDCPTAQTYWYFYVFLKIGFISFKGMDCYVL